MIESFCVYCGSLLITSSYCHDCGKGQKGDKVVNQLRERAAHLTGANLTLLRELDFQRREITKLHNKQMAELEQKLEFCQSLKEKHHRQDRFVTAQNDRLRAVVRALPSRENCRDCGALPGSECDAHVALANLEPGDA